MRALLLLVLLFDTQDVWECRAAYDHFARYVPGANAACYHVPDYWPSEAPADAWQHELGCYCINADTARWYW